MRERASARKGMTVGCPNTWLGVPSNTCSPDRKNPSSASNGSLMFSLPSCWGSSMVHQALRWSSYAFLKIYLHNYSMRGSTTSFCCSPSPEQALDVGKLQLDIGRAAV